MYSHLYRMSCSKNAGAIMSVQKKTLSKVWISCQLDISPHVGQLRSITSISSMFIPLLCNIVQTASWPCCWIVGVYSHACSSHAIQFEPLGHLFPITSIIWYNLVPRRGKTWSQENNNPAKYLTNFSKTGPGETATQPTPFSKTYSRRAQCGRNSASLLSFGAKNMMVTIRDNGQMSTDTEEVFPKERNDFSAIWLKSTRCVNSQKKNEWFGRIIFQAIYLGVQNAVS